MSIAGDVSLKISLAPASFQAGLRQLTDLTASAGRAMGRSLKEPINAGLKSARKEIGSMFSDLKDGLRTVGTLGGALAVGSFVRDAVVLQQTYGNMAAQVNKVAGNTQTWQTIQQMVQAEIAVTGQKAEDLSATFMEVFKETASVEQARAAMRAVGIAATATGQDINVLAQATQIAMTKFGIKTPEEALARVISGTGVGGKRLEQLGGSFEMLGEAAAASGTTGGEAMSMMLNLITTMGDKAEPGLNAMFQSMKSGSGKVLALQKAMGGSVKFTADMTSLDRIRATFMSDKGRKAAEKLFKADARVVYDKLAEPFDQAYQDAKKAGLSNAAATKAGLEAFDKFIRQAGTATADFAQIQRDAAARIDDDPGKKLDIAVEKIRQAFASPKVLSALDRLADKLPAFADTVIKVINLVIDNPWETVAAVVGGKLALAFGGSMISEVIASGMKGLFVRALAVQAASGAASVATAGATSLGVGGAVGAGVAGAGTGAGAIMLTGAVVAGAALAAGAVGAGIGTAMYHGGGIGDRQNKEFDAVRGARETLMETNSAKTPAQIKAAMRRLDIAKKNLDQGSTMNTLVGLVAAPFVGNAKQDVKNDLTTETIRLREALRILSEGVKATGESMKGGSGGTSRGPLRPAESNPGARPVGG
jgi:hypothetical protein